MFYFNYPAVALTILGSIAPSGAGATMISLVGCCLVLFFQPKMNCVKMSDVSVEFHCIESRQWFQVLTMRNFTICFTNCFTICSESCQSVAVLVLTMRQQVREVHSFSQSPAAGCKHQQHNFSLLFLSVAIASSRIVNTRPFLTQFIIASALNLAIGSAKNTTLIS